ncbi:MAG: hypothetical protein Q9159_003462 [Coniocarpon cinnabarinum]
MASSVLLFLAWTFLPDFLTNHAQSILYTTFYRAGDPHPAPGTPLHTRHRQRIYLTILLLYFAYTLYEAHWELVRQPTLYDILGLPPNAPEKAVSSKYRRLSLQHHPDKLAPGETYDDASFVILTTARDVLLDPAKRFAYERFGPDILSWQHQRTVRDFVDFGLKHTVAPYYLGWSVILAICQWLGWGGAGAFWRWWTLAGLAAFEVACVTRQSYPQSWMLGAVSALPVVHKAVEDFAAQWSMILGLKPYLPFQTVSYLRRASLTFFVGLSRLGPLLSQMAAARRSRGLSPAGAMMPEGDEETKTLRILQRLEQLVQLQRQEAGRVLATNCVPFAPSTADSVVQIRDGGRGQGMEDLRRGLKDWAVKNALRSDAEVRRAYSRAVGRSNSGVVEELDGDEDCEAS